MGHGQGQVLIDEGAPLVNSQSPNIPKQADTQKRLSICFRREGTFQYSISNHYNFTDSA